MSKVHDNEIISYTVDLKNKTIVIHTQCRSSGLRDYIEIIFSDVLAHYFENELSGSIIFDIEKYDTVDFIEDNESLLKKHKNSCWPVCYDTLNDLSEKLLKEQYGYYAITSSYGLNGWILAKNCEFIINN